MVSSVPWLSLSLSPLTKSQVFVTRSNSFLETLPGREGKRPVNVCSGRVKAVSYTLRAIM